MEDKDMTVDNALNLIRDACHILLFCDETAAYENDELGSEYLILAIAALNQARAFGRLAQKLTKK